MMDFKNLIARTFDGNDAEFLMDPRTLTVKELTQGQLDLGATPDIIVNRDGTVAHLQVVEYTHDEVELLRQLRDVNDSADLKLTSIEFTDRFARNFDPEKRDQADIAKAETVIMGIADKLFTKLADSPLVQTMLGKFSRLENEIDALRAEALRFPAAADAPAYGRWSDRPVREGYFPQWVGTPAARGHLAPEDASRFSAVQKGGYETTPGATEHPEDAIRRQAPHPSEAGLRTGPTRDLDPRGRAVAEGLVRLYAESQPVVHTAQTTESGGRVLSSGDFRTSAPGLYDQKGAVAATLDHLKGLSLGSISESRINGDAHSVDKRGYLYTTLSDEEKDTEIRAVINNTERAQECAQAYELMLNPDQRELVRINIESQLIRLESRTHRLVEQLEQQSAMVDHDAIGHQLDQEIEKAINAAVASATILINDLVRMNQSGHSKKW